MKKLLIILSTFALLSSCETVDLEGTQDPRALPEALVDKEKALTTIQVNFANFFATMAKDSRGCVRMTNQFGTYNAAADPQNTQTQWTAAYQNVLKQIKLFEESNNTTDSPYHIAMVKIIKAYTYVTLVDFYGDVPYTEALNDNITNPHADSGESIYNSMLSELTTSINLLSQPAPFDLPDYDFYYGQNGTNAFLTSSGANNWIKLANSLKLKMYNNLRLTKDVSASVNSIVSSGLYMQSNADDFNFKYSNIVSPVDSRHPEYVENYDGAPEFYLSNTFFKLLFQDKSVIDPRRRCYFYRQTLSAPSGTNLPCSGNSNIPICYVGAGTWGNGYWGRDHADNTGIPGDAARRTVIGLYPFGGKYDGGAGVSVANSIDSYNAKGAGILNILDYSYVQFILAELSLTEAGVTGTPLTYLNNGVNANITKVLGFRTDLQYASVPTAATVTSYKNAVTAKYNSATNDTDRLNTIIKEYYIACWGNGMEAYNMYRRTGMPLHNSANIGMQSPVISANSFNRSFSYPSNAVNNNTNLIQKSIITPVFWDNNPAGFID